jgi:hypothetical protein
MNCPECTTSALKRWYARRGAHIDVCLRCSGLWLQAGGILMFAPDPDEAVRRVVAALASSRRRCFRSPVSGGGLVAVDMGGALLYSCPSSGGCWIRGCDVAPMRECGFDLSLAQFSLDDLHNAESLLESVVRLPASRRGVVALAHLSIAGCVIGAFYVAVKVLGGI